MAAASVAVIANHLFSSSVIYLRPLNSVLSIALSHRAEIS